MALSRRHLMAGALAAAALAYGAGDFRATLAAERRRVAGRALTAATRSGPLEYAVAGQGPPVLVLHGTGGGFDQGLLIAGGLAERGFGIIAPSRFGYLGTPMPVSAGPAAEADAMVDLLDHLDIDRLAVVGASAGALPAMEMALRHPGRCAALALLVPAANLAGADPVAFTMLQERLVRTLLGSDVWFWAALRLAPDRVMRMLLATDPALMDRVSPDERARARRMLHAILPVRERAAGMVADAKAAGGPAGFEPSRIAVPTLVVSAEDDLFGTAATARRLAREIPGARLLVFENGGHIFLGRQDEMSGALAAFLRSGPGRDTRITLRRSAPWGGSGWSRRW